MCCNFLSACQPYFCFTATTFGLDADFGNLRGGQGAAVSDSGAAEKRQGASVSDAEKRQAQQKSVAAVALGLREP